MLHGVTEQAAFKSLFFRTFAFTALSVTVSTAPIVLTVSLDSRYSRQDCTQYEVVKASSPRLLCCLADSSVPGRDPCVKRYVGRRTRWQPLSTALRCLLSVGYNGLLWNVCTACTCAKEGTNTNAGSSPRLSRFSARTKRQLPMPCSIWCLSVRRCRVRCVCVRALVCESTLTSSKVSSLLGNMVCVYWAFNLLAWTQVALTSGFPSILRLCHIDW